MLWMQVSSDGGLPPGGLISLCLSPQFQQEIQHRQNEASRESRKKEKLEKELKQIQLDMDGRQSEIKAMQQYMHKSKEELQRLEQQLKEQKVSVASVLPSVLLSSPSPTLLSSPFSSSALLPSLSHFSPSPPLPLFPITSLSPLLPFHSLLFSFFLLVSHCSIGWFLDCSPKPTFFVIFFPGK